MAKFVSSLLYLIGLIAIIECEWKFIQVYTGGFQAELSVPIDQDLSDGWNLELTFDDKVLLQVMIGGKIKSQQNEKHFIVVNDESTKVLKKSSTLKLQFQAKADQDAGVNLIKAVFNSKNVDIGVVATVWPITIPPIGTKGDYDYNKVLHASLLFYEAQRSGKLPADNRIHWRGDSMLDDKGSGGEDLSGGYYDAGDLVKFGFPMAYAITVVSWGVVDYEDAYVKAGELENVHKMIKWGTDYFIKCHTKEREFYGQVGDGGADHGVWSRPEDWGKTGLKRPAFKITESAPGSDLAGETAAAMAAASIVFRKSDPTYSAKLLTHAKQLYDFANEKREKYSTSISAVNGYYSSMSGYGDELGWSAAWLLRATNDTKYKTDFEKHWSEFKLSEKPLPPRIDAFFWDDKTRALQVLIAKITGEEKYKKIVETFCDYLLKDAKRSPKGMLFYAEKWGPLRHSSNAALLLLQAADLGINSVAYRELAKNQIGYALGDTGRSFVVGIGVNPPQRPHHRPSSCPNIPAQCDYAAFDNPGPNPQVLTGALVGGPDETDSYEDSRKDYVHNEVAMDYNSGFQSAVAGLAHLKNKGFL